MTLREFANRYDGERIFLVGNGPSLKETPLDALTDEYSLAMNGINFIYGETEWRPTFYFFFQENFKQTKREHVAANVNSSTICFLNDTVRPEFGDHENLFYVGKRELGNDPLSEGKSLNETTIQEIRGADIDDLERFWSPDPAEQLYTYHSMYGAIQLAVYMGFSKIYLIGCDLGFEEYNPFLPFEDALDPLKEDLYLDGDGPLNPSYHGFFRPVSYPQIESGFQRNGIAEHD